MSTLLQVLRWDKCLIKKEGQGKGEEVNLVERNGIGGVLLLVNGRQKTTRRGVIIVCRSRTGALGLSPVLAEYASREFVPNRLWVGGGLLFQHVHPLLVPAGLTLHKHPGQRHRNAGRKTLLVEHLTDRPQHVPRAHVRHDKVVRKHVDVQRPRVPFQRVRPRHHRRHKRVLPHHVAPHVADTRLAARDRRRHRKRVLVLHRVPQHDGCEARRNAVRPQRAHPVERRQEPVSGEPVADALRSRHHAEDLVQDLAVRQHHAPVRQQLDLPVESHEVHQQKRHLLPRERQRHAGTPGASLTVANDAERTRLGESHS
eukprot:Rhum_TRINITY_DN15422_c7_g3::Rhum_TRINITY_DN15422_c7_g3_i4::g.156790::m.156790